MASARLTTGRDSLERTVVTDLFGHPRRESVTRAPPEGRFSARTDSPCASATARTIASPRPVVASAPASSLTNGSNAWSRRSARNPGPRSSTTNTTSSSRRSALTRITPPGVVPDRVVEDVAECLADAIRVDPDLDIGAFIRGSQAMPWVDTALPMVFRSPTGPPMGRRSSVCRCGHDRHNALKDLQRLRACSRIFGFGSRALFRA
jgi:hypothetical protein